MHGNTKLADTIYKKHTKFGYKILLYCGYSHSMKTSLTTCIDWNQYCNFGEAQAVSSLMMVYVNRNMLEKLL